MTENSEIVKFKSLNGFESIAQMFNIPEAELWDLLINKKSDQYETFEVLKKDGTIRTIYSPKPILKRMQRILANILSETYRVYPMAMGFVKNRNLIMGAEFHLNQKSMLSIDLKDFFPSINFARVRAMFKTYFKFNTNDATTLASICCHPNGELPQGSPVSPIISNIICHKMDQQINRLCRKYKCVYTRYADDISISYQYLEFPYKIAKKSSGIVEIGTVLEQIINNNGFEIQSDKTRLKNKFQSLSVTGIKVNKKLNVDRKYIRRIRSILHTIEKNDLKKANEIFCEEYRNRKGNISSNMFVSLRGMISYVGQVKGTDDLVFNKLAKRFNDLAKKYDLLTIKRIPGYEELRDECVFPIFGGDDDMITFKVSMDGILIAREYESILDQGTGFYLKDIGIVTSAHLYLDLKEKISAYGIENLKFKNEFYITLQKKDSSVLKAKIGKINYDLDIAILIPEESPEIGFEYSESYSENDVVKLLGFPEYRLGNTIRVEDGKVGGRREENRVTAFELMIAKIHSGNSGGPIIDESNNVIGVAAKGFTGDGIVPSQVIPIEYVLNLVNNKV